MGVEALTTDGSASQPMARRSPRASQASERIAREGASGLQEKGVARARLVWCWAGRSEVGFGWGGLELQGKGRCHFRGIVDVERPHHTYHLNIHTSLYIYGTWFWGCSICIRVTRRATQQAQAASFNQREGCLIWEGSLSYCRETGSGLPYPGGEPFLPVGKGGAGCLIWEGSLSCL